MMHVHHQHIPSLACAQHLYSQQRRFFKHEWRNELLQPLLHFILRRFRKRHLDMPICLNPLHKLTVHRIKCGAQTFMAPHKLGKRLPQTLQIQFALHVQRHRHIVGYALCIQLAYHIHSFLS
ncbi:hypothetical protein D3C78_1380060 [compost metagenome]